MNYFKQISQKKITSRMYAGLGLNREEQNEIRKQQRGSLKNRVKLFLSHSFMGRLIIRCYRISLLPYHFIKINR